MRSAAVFMEEEILTIEQVAKKLGFHRHTVENWVKSGELTASKLGKEYRIRESDLDDFMRRKQIKPRQE